MSTPDLGFTERSGVASVLVGVTVRDSHGRFVKGLPQDEFRLFNNDKPAPITFFAPEGWPSEIVLAIDISGSMDRSAGAVRHAVAAFLPALGPEDHVTLAAFNTAFFVIAPRTASPEMRLRALNRLSAWGGTALYDAALSGLDLLDGWQGRRALILFTDGEDRSSQVSSDRVEQRLLADDVILYVVGHGSAAELPSVRGTLERIAQTSGGRALFLSNVDKADEAFREILDDLTQQYTLGFTPPNTKAGERQNLRVELASGNYRVKSRAGYVSRESDGK